jgi:hypothetical protein
MSIPPPPLCYICVANRCQGSTFCAC